MRRQPSTVTRPEAAEGYAAAMLGLTREQCPYALRNAPEALADCSARIQHHSDWQGGYSEYLLQTARP